MKTRNERPFGTLALVTALASLTAASGFAIAKPIQQPLDQDAVSISRQADERPQAEQQTQTQHAYLGVFVKPLGPDTARQLQLPDATGLRLMQVAPDSPAQQAGLQAGDVLTHLNDQMLVNPQQLTVLVRTHAPGDTVTLRIVREGQAMTLETPLAARERQGPAIDPQIDRDRLERPEDLIPRLRVPDPFAQPAQPGDRIQRHRDLNDLFEQMHQRMNQQRHEMHRMLDQMRQQMQLDHDAFEQMPRLDFRGMPGVQSNLMLNDGEHTIRLRTQGDQRHLTLKTRAGEVLFDGPMPEDGQIQGIPDALQQKIDGLLNHNRIEWRINPAPQPDAEPKGPVA